MAQLRDLIVNGPSRFLGVSTYNEDVILNKGAIAYAAIIPGETLTYNLGTADNSWLNVYGATLRASTAVIVTGAAEATAANAGAVQVTGGIYVAKKSLFGNDIYLGSTSYYLNGTTSKLNKLITASDLTVGGNAVPSETNKKSLGTDSLRWANLYIVNGNASGSLAVAGTVTSTGGFIGNLTGNVTGNVTGDVTGDVMGVADRANRLTKSGGSADRPVYFVAEGTPQATTYRMAGTNTTATTAIAINSATDTGIWYVNGTADILGISDGVAIVNKYSDSWITQIYQDYRTGQLAVRGKNNGTWQDWRVILDEDNFTNYLDGHYNGKYVLKTGDTMSGPLTIQESANQITLSTGGSITTQATTTGGWARTYNWTQRNDSSSTATTKVQMGAYGAGATLNYWYVGTGWANDDTWLQVNSTGTTVKGTLSLNKHLYLTGANSSSSTSNTTQIVFGTPTNNHVAISSNSRAIVINPSVSDTSNQIVLYLDTQSKFPGGLDVTAASKFASDVSIGGNLQVTGSIKGLSTLAITGAATLSNTLSVTGGTTLGNSLSVTGATTLKSTLGVTGATTLSSTLSVAGATTLKSTLGVTGATTLSSTLTVSGKATFNGDVAAAKTLSVTGATTLASTLSVAGNTSLSGNLDVTGNITGLSKLSITGATTLSNTLSVSGAATMSNTLTVSKLITGSKGLYVSGRVYDSGDDEGIVVGPASNGYAGITLGSSSGVRSVFYLLPSSSTHRAVWRYSNGTDSWNVTHPETNGELIVHTADTAVGSSTVPVYIAASGVATAITCLEASKGGTGNTNLVSGRLVYTEAYNGSVRMTSGGNHYADSTKVAINSTAAPAGALHVQGDTSINGAITLDSKVKFVYNSTNESVDFVFI